MNTLIVKSGNRLYKLFKVYTTLAVIGALATILVEIIVAQPLVLIAPFIIAAFASSVVLLWAQSRGKHNRDFIRKGLANERPPKLPESLMMVSLPIEIADLIMADLTGEFSRLRSKYGRTSAVSWYTIQSASIFLRVTAFHFGIHREKNLTQFLKKGTS